MNHNPTTPREAIAALASQLPAVKTWLEMRAQLERITASIATAREAIVAAEAEYTDDNCLSAYRLDAAQLAADLAAAQLAESQKQAESIYRAAEMAVADYFRDKSHKLTAHLAAAGIPVRAIEILGPPPECPKQVGTDNPNPFMGEPTMTYRVMRGDEYQPSPSPKVERMPHLMGREEMIRRV